MKTVNLSPDPAEGPAAPPTEAGPAATAVINGKTERELALERDLTAEKDAHAHTAAAGQARQTQIAALEEQLRLLREPPAAAPPSGPPAEEPPRRRGPLGVRVG